jgi:hypothetical protein
MELTIRLVLPRLTRTQRALSGVLLGVSLALLPAIALASDVFGDVPGTLPQHDAINRVYAAGIMRACTAGTPPNFCPNDPVLRAQQAAQWDRALGLNGTPAAGTYVARAQTVDDGAITTSKLSSIGSDVGQVLTSTGAAVVWQTPAQGVTSVSASAPLLVTNGSSTPNVSMPAADADQSGYLSASDWATFNGKQTRVSGVCLPGTYVREIAVNGTVTCQSDANTTYSAGSGLSLSGTVFGIADGGVGPSKIGTIPGARVTRSSALATTSHAVTAVTFDQEAFDTANLHDETNGSRLTAPIAGMYSITAAVRWAFNTTGTRFAGISSNGTLVWVASSWIPATVGLNTRTDQVVSTILRLSAGEFVEVMVFQDSGSSLDLESTGSDAQPSLAMVWMGP